VYRVDDVESGRITPTMPVAFGTGLGGLVGGGGAEGDGGLVSLQIALTVPAAPLDEPDAALLLPELQAARVRTAAVPIAASGNVELRGLRA
jgi:hypothetical protein